MIETDVDGLRTAAAASPRWVYRVGVGTWSFIGAAIALAIVFSALATVSEIVLPMVFAAVLAVLLKPAVQRLEQRNIRPTLAAGAVVIGLVLLVVAIVVVTINGVVTESGEIGSAVDAALDEGAETLSVDRATLHELDTATGELSPLLTEGVLTRMVSGVGTIVGFIGGSILGVLILYYLLKDGSRIRRSLVDRCGPSVRADVDGFLSDSCGTIRAYGRGRTVMSAVVATVVGLASLLAGLPLILTIVVVNFIGGYIPYIGAFIGGGLAVLLALGEGGPGLALAMLVVVLTANLVLENVVEPKVMGRSLDIHPLAVLIVTTLGGVLGGIVGLLLAVPVAVIVSGAFRRLGDRGVFETVAGQAALVESSEPDRHPLRLGHREETSLVTGDVDDAARHG